MVGRVGGWVVLFKGTETAEGVRTHRLVTGRGRAVVVKAQAGRDLGLCEASCRDDAEATRHEQ